ncbi:hypothetical protein V6N13_098671 [Hibiscus sabdariffa]
MPKIGTLLYNFEVPDASSWGLLIIVPRYNHFYMNRELRIQEWDGNAWIRNEKATCRSKVILMLMKHFSTYRRV